VLATIAFALIIPADKNALTISFATFLPPIKPKDEIKFMIRRT